MTSRSLTTGILLCLALTILCTAEEIHGKVVAVTDGDTLKVLQDKATFIIRLEGIDAPEIKQPFGTQAKKALSELAFGKEAVVKWEDRDRYGRILGHVYVGDVWVNKALVEQGMAWFYHKSKTKVFKALEDTARKEKRGLWADKKPLSPWDWRANHIKKM